MEVEFDIKMTPGALYDYMLFHTFTSPAGLIGGVIGALLIVAFFMGRGVLCLITGLIILVYLPWTLFLKSRQQYQANSSFKEPLHYRLDEEGITVSQNGEAQSQKWEDIYKATSTFRSVLVYTSKVNAAIFTKKELGDKTSAVIQIISTHMPPAKVKIRS